jgi:hypothetical protein
MKLSWRRIRRDLTGDKRKFAVGMALTAVALLLWGRLLLKDVPRTAVAEPKEPIAELQAPSTPAARPDKPRGQTVVLPAYGPIERDLFAFDGAFYPQVESIDQTVDSRPKSPADPTDEQVKEQRLRASIRIEARSLKLQSTLLGRRPRAMINGQLLEPGQTIQGFELKEVRTRQVTLVKRGLAVELEM